VLEGLALLAEQRGIDLGFEAEGQRFEVGPRRACCTSCAPT
jgi:hypothetical protein